MNNFMKKLEEHNEKWRPCNKFCMNLMIMAGFAFLSLAIVSFVLLVILLYLFF